MMSNRVGCLIVSCCQLVADPGPTESYDKHSLCCLTSLKACRNLQIISPLQGSSMSIYLAFLALIVADPAFAAEPRFELEPGLELRYALKIGNWFDSKDGKPIFPARLTVRRNMKRLI